VCWDLNCLSHLAEETGGIKMSIQIATIHLRLKPHKTKVEVVGGV